MTSPFLDMIPNLSLNRTNDEVMCHGGFMTEVNLFLGFR
jgi:hypothetical protein